MSKTTVKPKKAKGPKILKKDHRQLPVKLTPEELEEAGQQLAQTCVEIERLEEKKKEATSFWKNEIHQKITRRQHLTDMVKDKTEYRDVPVQEMLDGETGMVRTVRMDTAEVIHERRAMQGELQTNLVDQADKAESGEADPEKD